MIDLPCSERRPTERVYWQIRDALFSQEFELGERLRINELADQYRVSNTPVREALSRLRAEQLIGFRPGRGYYFRIPALDELQDLYKLLKVLLCSSVCERSYEKLKQPLERIVTQAEALDFGSTEARLAHWIEMVYEQAVAVSGNKAVLRVAENVIARTHFVRLGVLESVDRRECFLKLFRKEDFEFINKKPEHLKKVTQDSIDAEIQLLPGALRDLIAGPYLCNGKEFVG